MSEGPPNAMTDLEALERFVVDNDDLLALEERIGRFNIFDALGIARVEIRHTNFLAWLLDPAESHGQGPLFLRAILMDLLKTARENGADAPISPIELDGAELRGVEIRREWKHIDLLIKCDEPRFVIAVENKVDSGPHNDFETYEREVRGAFGDYPSMFVYLTPTGDELDEDNWTHYSYADIHRVLTRVRRTNAESIGDDVLAFLDHYLRLIGSRFMDDPNLDALCQTIYKNHRQALQLIYERVGSPEASVVAALEAAVREASGWKYLNRTGRLVQFVPTTWSDLLPPIGRRKMFDPRQWIVVQFNVRPRRFFAEIRVWPTTDGSTRRAIIKRLVQNQDEFGLRTIFKDAEKIGENWATLGKVVLATWNEGDAPDEELLTTKARVFLSDRHDQLASVADALQPIVKNWKPVRKGAVE